MEADLNQVNNYAGYIFISFIVILFLSPLLLAILAMFIEMIAVFLHCLVGAVVAPICVIMEGFVLLVASLIGSGVELAKKANRRVQHAAVGVLVLGFVVLLTAWLSNR